MSTTQLVEERKARNFLSALGEAEKKHPADARIQRLRCDSHELTEEMSNGDWARVGALAGLLWYKLDVVIRHLDAIANNTARTK